MGHRQADGAGRRQRREWRVWLVAVVGVAATAVIAWHTISPPAPTHSAIRSVVLVTIDTLRADHLSAYGYQRATSPQLDAFMARGTRFAWALSAAPTTAPSHVAMMTGLYPGFTTVGVLNGQFPLSPEASTLAELCREAGLRTAAVVSNAVLMRPLGLDQGFDSYDDDLEDRELNRVWAERTAARAVPKALAQLAQLRGSPFFLWLHFQEPHGPYAPPTPWAQAFAGDSLRLGPNPELPVGADNSGLHSIPAYQRFDDERRPDQYVRRYDAEIAYLDSELARLFDLMTGSGLLQDTLVVITADHGEALGEDDFYFAHGHSLGLDQLHVPLAMIGPGIAAGAVRQRAVSNITVFCTILNALGLSQEQRCEQSDSIWASLLAGEEPPAMLGYAGSVTQWATFQAGWFLRRDAYAPEAPVFAPAGDPVTDTRYRPLGEQLAVLTGERAPEPQEQGQIRQALGDFISRAETARNALASKRQPAAALPPEQKERLRLLGYLR
ncbi:MAG: sulfatase [Deltaproteobacteria bacterium]|nr:sulfatase [Deltaproteobacteria bacterium]